MYTTRLVRNSFLFSTFLTLPIFNQNPVMMMVASAEFAKEASEFIGERIISAHLYNCSVIMVTEIKNGREKNQSAFLSNVTTSALHQLKSDNNINKAVAVTMMTLQSDKKVQRKTALLKFSTFCKIVITMLVSEISPGDSELFKQLISTEEKELTKRDEDYYIFIATSEQVSRSFLSAEIAFLLKYKIAIFPHTPAASNPNEAAILIQTVCIYCPESEERIIAVSTDNPLLLSHIFPDFTKNVHQFSVWVSAPTKYPSTYEMQKMSDGTYRHKRGIHTVVFNTVIAKLNMTYRVRPCSKFGNIPEGTSTGFMLANRTWAGCMGDVINGASDMALSISPDVRRFDYVHFSAAMAYSYVTYITSKPGVFYSWKVVFTALKALVWALVFASILLTTAAIYLMDYYVGLYKHFTKLAERTPSFSSLLNKLFDTELYLMGYLAGQGMSPPNSFSSCLVYLTWLYYGLVIGAAYASSLQALIVSPGLKEVPRTFLELVDSSNYKWGAARGFIDGMGEQLFKNSGNPTMRALYGKMERDADEIPCTHRALISQYACWDWEIMQKFHLKTEFADKTGDHPFQEATETAFFVSVNFITRKRELYRSHFNNFIARAFDSGLASHILTMDSRIYRMGLVNARKAAGKLSPYENNGGEGPQPFTLDSVMGCFIVLLSGLTLGVSAFLAEKIAFRMQPKEFSSIILTVLK